jgi:hypothetical protein
MRQANQKTADLIADILLTTLAGNLLYLYLVGSLQELNAIALSAKLIALFTVSFWGLLRLHYHLYRGTQKWNKENQ